jgi:DNA (cytosine-5)-methyltransferase 1
MNSLIKYIDLFAGAGGLSEGFIREGFSAVAHVEMNKEATDTLKTRMAYHYLISRKKKNVYLSYLKNEISRDELWNSVPKEIIDSVINTEISDTTIHPIFDKIDILNNSEHVDLIIGGPPCQAYSLVGRSRDPKRMEGDARNYLFKYYAKFLEKYKPTCFVFENVLGLLTAGNKKYFNEMIILFQQLGYNVEFDKLLASDYGVLQNRQRVIIIGMRNGQKFDFSKIHRIKNNWKLKNEIFSDLPELKPGEELKIATYTQPINDYLEKSLIRNGIDFTTQHIARPHNSKDLEIYSIAIRKWIEESSRLKYSDLPKRLQSHKNTSSFLDRFKVVNPDGCSHTMVAHIAKDGHYYIYPDLKQVRSISVREAARIQSFPDDYFFEGGRSAAFKQIGNAVPPLMAQAIASKLKQLI